MIKIECIECRECFSIDEIKYSSEKIDNFKDDESLKEFAEESGVRFDCPHCETPMYLSDCEIF